jgi:lysophospholipase L1-like esterase
MLASILGFDVANAGVNGNTSAQGLSRMERDVLARKPEVVVIMFGTNDTRIDEPRVFVPVDRYEANLGRMIDACQKAGAKVVVCTIPPIDPAGYFTRHKTEPFEQAGGLPALLDRYRAAATRAADEKKATLVDLGKVLPDDKSWATKDGVHPTDAGTRALAEHVAKAVKPLLTPQAADAR